MLDQTDCKEKDATLQLTETIAQIIYEKSGKNIFAVDIRGVSALADFCLIAEGTVDRHVRAIAQTVEKELALLGHKAPRVDGAQEGHWVILDYLNIMVHVFTPALREKYNLERLWEEGTVVELNYKE